MFQCSLSQQICSLIHFLHTCFVGIHGVLGTQSKPNISNTTRCSDGSYEEERLQQLQDTSHEKKKHWKEKIVCQLPSIVMQHCYMKPMLLLLHEKIRMMLVSLIIRTKFSHPTLAACNRWMLIYLNYQN
jgi:hypothetical protein